MNRVTQIRIGIDPDLEKSGYCIISKRPFAPKWNIELLTTLRFFDVVAAIEDAKMQGLVPGNRVTVCIEAGWLNKSIHHYAHNKSVAGRIGKSVGENHAVGKLLVEHCQNIGVAHILVKPESKKWDSVLFKKITGWETRTNQEMRDACRTAWL